MDDEPEMPEVLKYLWDWFWELHRRRGGGFGPAPVSWQEIDCWARRTRVEPTVWEVRLLTRLDDEYLKYQAEKPKKSEGG